VSQTSASVDVVLSTVLANRLEAITREMGAAMLRSARSPIFAQNRDFVTALFDHRLQMVAQTSYIPVLLGSTPFAIQALNDFFAGDVQEGDVMIINDPFSGNNHLPDITVARPVFHEGRVRFWALARGHHADLGGGGTAGYNPEARTAWEEGLRITPSKLYRAGLQNRELWMLILTNVRLPFLVEGDLQCQVGATRIGERALLGLLERYGSEVVEAAIGDTLGRSEQQMRDQIRTMPNGVYIAERQLDNVMRDEILRPTVKLELRIDDDSISFDFAGTSPQIPTYHNSTYANTVACCYNALFSTIDPDIKLNAGSTRPIEVQAPQGTIANARNGAATTMCTVATCAVIVETAWLALAQAVPGLAQAHWARQGAAGMSSGLNPRTGKPFAVIHHFGKGGSGAAAGFDGWNHISPVSSMGGSGTPDPELFEMRSPHFIMEYELRPDTAGAGTWRGGHGSHYQVQFTSDSTAIILEPASFVPDTAPRGIQGGHDAPIASARVSRADGEIIDIQSPTLFRPRAGDVLEVFSTGGGGYGDPRQRPVEAVMSDVRAKLLTLEKARREYGVVVDPKTLVVDEEATRRLRSKPDQQEDHA
jgi:N-methylhydantoinase B